MRYFWLILGNLWMLPNTVVSAIYLGVLLLCGQVRYSRDTGECIIVWVVEDSWLWRYMAKGGWAAWASGVFIVARGETLNQDRVVIYHTTLVHEERHVQQQMVFGVFQPILYILASVFIWIFLHKRHSYYDNPFERDARWYAGQQLDIPKSQWKDGMTDRWAWWLLLIITGVSF